MKSEKKTYYKLVNEDYPTGIIYHEEYKDDCLNEAKEYRDIGQVAYVRKVRMTEAEFNNIEEI